MKSELAGLTLTQEASLKELKGVRKMPQRLNSPMRSGGDKSAARTTLRSLVAILIKAKNRKCLTLSGFSFIGIVRVRSKHTSYVLY